MKTLFLLSVLVIAANAESQDLYQGISVESSRSFIDTMINNTIMQIINSLPAVIETDAVNIALPSEGLLTGSANLTDLQITGHKGFTFTKLSVNVFSLSLVFSCEIPNLNIYTQYGADVLIGELIPIYGDGSLNVHLNNLTIVGSGKASIIGGLSVSNLTAGVYLGESTTFDIHGLLNNEAFSNIVSAILNENVATFIDDHYDLISSIISPLAQTLINGIFSGGSTNSSSLAEEVPLY